LQSFKEAARCYKIASDLHDGTAKVALGMLYVRGNGVNQNFVKSVKLFKDAMKTSEASGNAAFALGVMHKNGEGVSQNESEATSFYSFARDQGSVDAFFNLTAMDEKVHTFLGLHCGVGLKTSEKQDYMKLFDRIDTDRSGVLDFDEFVDALKVMDIFESETKSRLIFDQADEDRSGTVDREEFMKMMHRARTGTKYAELSYMAKASKDVFEKLDESNRWGTSLEDAMEAPVTKRATDEIENLKSMYAWVLEPSMCNEANCNFVFNTLVLEMDLIETLMRHVCIEMIEDVETKLQAEGIKGFIKNVNVQAVIDDGCRIFFTLMHRFAHTNTIVPSDMEYLHSLRKAGIIEAANDSVQEIRDLAKKVADPNRDHPATDFGKAAGQVVGQVVLEGIVLPALVGAGCCTM